MNRKATNNLQGIQYVYYIAFQVLWNSSVRKDKQRTTYLGRCKKWPSFGKRSFFPRFHISGDGNPAILVTSCWTVVIANTCPRCLEIQNSSIKKAKEGTSSSQASQCLATFNWMEACAFTYPLVFFLLLPLMRVRPIRFRPSMVTQSHCLRGSLPQRWDHLRNR